MCLNGTFHFVYAIYLFFYCSLLGINIGELISSCKTSPVHSAAPHPLALSCGAVARILDRHNEAVVSHERQVSKLIRETSSK